MKRSKKTLYQGKFLTLHGQDGWEFVSRNNCSGIVVILAMTENRNILFTEQYRIPLGKHVVEFPAGLVDDMGGEERETAEDAAKRELFEETGYEAGSLEHLVTGPISAGLCSEVISFYRARNLVKKSEGGGLGEYEQIKVHAIPLKEVASWLGRISQEGLLIDPKVYAGLYWLNVSP